MSRGSQLILRDKIRLLLVRRYQNDDKLKGAIKVKYLNEPARTGYANGPVACTSIFGTFLLAVWDFIYDNTCMAEAMINVCTPVSCGIDCSSNCGVDCLPVAL